MFTVSEANTSDRCKKLKSWYQSTLQESAIKTSSLINDHSLPDDKMEQAPLIVNDSCNLSDCNVNLSSQLSTDELLYEDPGCEKDEIYDWLKDGKILKLKQYQIK